MLYVYTNIGFLKKPMLRFIEKPMLLVIKQHRFLQNIDVWYQKITLVFSKNPCCLHILTSVLVKTDVDMKIYNFFFYNSYYITSVI